MLRRGLALGAALVVLILLVLGVKGCLDARAERALSDYARNVDQIVKETDQTSKAFFKRLEDPGNLSVTEFVDQVNADRSAVDTYASRIDGLDTPGDMSAAQDNLELVYQLRANAMNEIAAKANTALGDAGAAKATQGIARQMQKLLASDVIYESVARPEIENVLVSNNVDEGVPKSRFLPSTEWLDGDTVADALSEISGADTGDTDTEGVHGLGLVGVSVNGTELIEGAPASVSAEEAVEVEVQVQNQGESTESGVSVSVSAGGNAIEGDISSIEAGEISTVTIPLTPTPSGETTLEVEVEPVDGEQVTENNEATFTVIFE